jgi:predicted SAM-dependent methyltransferase
MKLNIGSYDVRKEGWTNIDIDPLAEPDIVTPAWDLHMFEDNSVDEIYSGHMIEHLDKYETRKTYKEWWRVLKPNGLLHVVVPDICKAIEMYWDKKLDMAWVERVAYGGIEERAAQAHKQLFNEVKLIEDLSNAGFSNLKGLDYYSNLPVCVVVGWQTGLTCRKPKRI